MSKMLIIFTVVWLAAASAYEIVQDEEGSEYYLLPVHNRQRRETKWGVSGGGDQGIRATVGQQGNLLDHNGHRLDGNAFVSKQFHPTGPASIGGGLQYEHKPSGSNFNLAAQRTERFGTHVSGAGTANIWRNNKGTARFDAVGRYDRQFGGPFGTSNPDYYVGVQYQRTF